MKTFDKQNYRQRRNKKSKKVSRSSEKMKWFAANKSGKAVYQDQRMCIGFGHVEIKQFYLCNLCEKNFMNIQRNNLFQENLKYSQEHIQYGSCLTNSSERCPVTVATWSSVNNHLTIVCDCVRMYMGHLWRDRDWNKNELQPCSSVLLFSWLHFSNYSWILNKLLTMCDSFCSVHILIDSHE